MSFDWHWLETIISTFVGAALTWFATRSERRSSRKHEELGLRRDKAEQVFIEIAKMERNASAQMLWAVQVRAGVKAPEPAVYDPSPLTALVSLYFPEGLPALGRKEDANTDSVRKRMATIANASEAYDAKKVQEVHALVAFEGSDAAMQAAKELRDLVRASVDPLTTR